MKVTLNLIPVMCFMTAIFTALRTVASWTPFGAHMSTKDESAWKTLADQPPGVIPQRMSSTGSEGAARLAIQQGQDLQRADGEEILKALFKKT